MKDCNPPLATEGEPAGADRRACAAGHDRTASATEPGGPQTPPTGDEKKVPLRGKATMGDTGPGRRFTRPCTQGRLRVRSSSSCSCTGLKAGRPPRKLFSKSCRTRADIAPGEPGPVLSSSTLDAGVRWRRRGADGEPLRETGCFRKGEAALRGVGACLAQALRKGAVSSNAEGAQQFIGWWAALMALARRGPHRELVVVESRRASGHTRASPGVAARGSVGERQLLAAAGFPRGPGVVRRKQYRKRARHSGARGCGIDRGRSRASRRRSSQAGGRGGLRKARRGRDQANSVAGSRRTWLRSHRPSTNLDTKRCVEI